MTKLINIGFGNMISSDKIVAIISPDSAPATRIIMQAKEKGIAVDATQGRRTRSIIMTDSSYVVLSALQPETIASRCHSKEMSIDTKGEYDE